MSVIYPWFRLVVPYNSAGLAKKANMVYYCTNSLLGQEWSEAGRIVSLGIDYYNRGTDMQVERKTPDLEAILKVFRDLGLEDAKVRDEFQKLAELGDWHTWRKRRLEPQDIQNNTESGLFT